MHMNHKLRLVLSVAALCALAAIAPLDAVPPDAVEPATDSAYAAAVREFTTDERFLSPLVAELPDHPGVPSPREFLGYVVGAPKKLTYYADIKAYMETLAETSPRVRLESMGKSNEGREMIVLFIAEEDVIRSLEKHAEYTRRLADPRETDEAAAEEVIDAALPFYYLCGGLHSPETGSPEMLMELAYRLAVGESPLIRRIRHNVITMITPVVETDGRERMVDWYYNVTIDYDDWDDMPPKAPPYWGKYVLHDNNRDGLQLTQPLTRNFMRTFFEYHPQVVHDLHESVPLLYVSSGTGPYNDALDPIATSEWQWLSNNEITEMTKYGMPGVWTWGFYTGWYPGYLMWIANNHNSIGRFYETFGNAGASTFERKLKEKFAGQEVTTRQWYRAWPPEKKVTWSLRDNVNYMETGVMVTLDFCARHNKTLLYNFWKKGHNSLERGRTQAPHAFVVPADNRTRYELSRFLETLEEQRIEVHVLDDDATAGDTSFAKGDFVVRMDQPYRDFARSLLEPQRFPEDSPYTPYDDVAWTLPLLYGVDVTRVDDPSILEASMTRLEGGARPLGPEPRKRPYYVVAASPSSKTLRARLELARFPVFAADTAFSAGGVEYPRGSWIIPRSDDGDGLYEAVRTVAVDLGLDVEGVRELPDVARHELDIPRIAVFHTWLYTQDSGWVRYAFDRDGIPYTLINKDDVRDGNLRDYYDVLLIPDTGVWFKPKDLIHGVSAEHGPIPYKSGMPGAGSSMGSVDESDDITGGIGFEGLAELERFVDAGGTLVTFGAASTIPVELGLVRHVDHIRPSGFVNPGSVVRTRIVDAASNLVAGYSDPSSVFRGNSPLLSVEDQYRNYVVLQYGTKDPEGDEDDEDAEKGPAPAGPICLSGMVKGAKSLDGKPAILDIRRGDGRVVIYTFNPMHRYLNLSDFGLAYNAILHWND